MAAAASTLITLAIDTTSLLKRSAQKFYSCQTHGGDLIL
jgi:hypothetical protein